MTDCNEAVGPVHSRMLVLLHEKDIDLWLRGTLADVMSFQQRCVSDELIQMERTNDPWLRQRGEPQ